MGLYSKFNKTYNTDKGVFVDCVAYFKAINGLYERLGSDENGNVEKCLSESEVMSERIKLNVPFASLKTESEIMADVHLPE